MEIILTQDVERLGSKDDVVKVKDGYARNYLIPRKKRLRQAPVQRKYWLKTSDSVHTKKQN